MPAPRALLASSPRRSTRVASLARFRYRECPDDIGGSVVAKDEPASDSDSSLSDLSLGSDIEDAVVSRRARPAVSADVKTETTVTRKRKRAGTRTAAVTKTLTATGLPSRKKAAAAAVKQEGDMAQSECKEIKEEEEDALAAAATISQDVPPAPPPRRSRAARKTPRVIKAETKEKTPRVIKAETKENGGENDAVVEPPSDWEEIYALVKAMRLGDGPAAHAAVDTMGCERLAAADASPRDRRFHTLVALMLSSQTKDTVNAVVMARLQAELPPYQPGAPPGLNLENLLAVAPDTLNKLIWQVGFHNNKTRYLQQAARILRDQWGGDIPSTAEGLMALPGVGPKMAYLCLSAEHGWNRVEGIGVDVHVHRITNLWGWQKAGSAAAKTPEGTRLALQSWLPHDRWKEINWLLVGFGQTVCLPQGAKCDQCTVGLRGLCRAANRKKVAEGRKRLQEQQAAE